MPSQARVRWDLAFQGLGAPGPHLNRAPLTEQSQTMPLGPSPPPTGPQPPGPVSPQQPASDVSVPAALHGHPPASPLLHDHFRHPR